MPSLGMIGEFAQCVFDTLFDLSSVSVKDKPHPATVANVIRAKAEEAKIIPSQLLRRSHIFDAKSQLYLPRFPLVQTRTSSETCSNKESKINMNYYALP